MSDARIGQLKATDSTGALIGFVTEIVATGAGWSNGKLDLSTLSGGVGADASSYKGASAPSAAEFNYLAGVTSLIQTQLNARLVAANNLSDLGNASTARTNLGLGTAATLNTGTSSGNVPVLGVGGKLASAVLPAIAITDTFVVASQAAMLALSTAETGDVAVRTDLNKSFILAGTDPATLAHWQELLTPTDAVLSVNGQTGAVTLTTSHITEGSNLYYTNTRADARIAAAVGVSVQAFDATLSALAAFNTNGLLVQTAADTFAARTLTPPAAGLTITNPAGTAGNPTFALANDLAALEGLSSTGLAVRTGSDAWAQRSVAVTPSTGLAVTNGDGVAGNPTLAGVDASTTVKGVASFNSTNFSVASGAVNTVQNIHTGASPAFTGLTLSGNLSAAGVASSLIPSVTDTYDLGSSTKLWRKGWLSELDAVLFAQNTVSLIGGWLMATKNEGAIPVGQDVGTGDTSIDFGQAMTANDFVLFRAAGSVEYVQVGTLSSGTRYNVTRNLDGSGANAWPAGSVYAVLGNTTNGRIEINANSTPRISLIKQGATYNAQTELVRVGDLNGWGAYSSETYGFVAGEYASGKSWVSVDQTNGFRIGNNTAVIGQWDASGNVTLGQVANNSGNAYWNNSNKRLEFRGGAGGTVVQTYVDTAGAIVGAAGNFILDSAGVRIIADTAFSAVHAYSITDGSAGNLLALGAYSDSNTIYTALTTNFADTGKSSLLTLTSQALAVNKAAALELAINSTTYGSASFLLHAPDAFGSFAVLSTTRGLSIGTNIAPSSGYLLDVGGNINSTGIVNAVTGFRYNGGATSGHVMRGNGTNIVLAQLAAADLSNGVTGSGSVVLAASPTFTGTTTIPAVSGNVAFDTNTLYVDATNNRVGIGTASPGTDLDVVKNSASDVLLRVWNSGSGSAKMRFVAADGVEPMHQWTHSTTFTAAIAGNNNLANQNLNYLAFRVRNAADANTEAGLIAATRMTINGLGSVGFNTTDFGSGGGVLGIKDATTVPTTNPAAGHVLYSQAGALKGRGSSGTVTTIAAAEPHCPACERDFVLEWQNDAYGHLLICMWCLTDGLKKGVVLRSPSSGKK